MGRNKLKRTHGTITPKHRICILTEGSVTEPEYFRGLCDSFGIPKELVVVRKARSIDPKGMVDEIVDMKRANARETKKGRETLIDQWWVVCDTECRTDRISNAIQKARDNDVFIAASDPSFEYWLIRHCHYTTAPYGSLDKLIKDLGSGCLPGYNANNKHLDITPLLSKLDEAMGNARLARKNHTLAGHSQPLTDCDILVDALAEQAKEGTVGFRMRKLDVSDPSMRTVFSSRGGGRSG